MLSKRCCWAVAGSLFVALAAARAADVNRLVIHADQGKTQISRNIYGHFAEHLGHCIYGGVWVGEDSPIPNTRGIRNDIVAALKQIKAPVVRWPGGCFADTYHWKDGIGPHAKRPSMINVHWGGVTENNHFGTHEFMDFCAQVGCEPYICGNLGSGTVQEMIEWVEYVTFPGVSPMADWRRQNGRAEPWRLPFFGVGNENWGCGGSMTPEFYADQYRRYATYIRSKPGNKIYRIACGPSGADYKWTEVLMQRVPARQMEGLALHYYCGSGKQKQLATQFAEADWATLLKKALYMEELVTKHAVIMDIYDPQKKIGLLVDEWGTWHLVEPGTNPGFLYQQNTLRDALVAGITLNIFNQHADRVRMANIAQTINVLQAMILTDGPKMTLTPTYHVYDLYTPHHDATLLPTELTCADYVCGTDTMPGLSASASRDKTGTINVTLCNLNPNQPAELQITLSGTQVKSIFGRVLTAATMQAHNTFAQPDAVKPMPFTDYKQADSIVSVTLPAKSVVALSLGSVGR